MRLDHLLSREEASRGCFAVELSMSECAYRTGGDAGACSRQAGGTGRRMSHDTPEKKRSGFEGGQGAARAKKITEPIWRRCGWGTHPYPSRTRRLRPSRPMILHWRRCGKAGGCQIKKRKRTERSVENREPGGSAGRGMRTVPVRTDVPARPAGRELF